MGSYSGTRLPISSVRTVPHRARRETRPVPKDCATLQRFHTDRDSDQSSLDKIRCPRKKERKEERRIVEGGKMETFSKVPISLYV